MEPREQEDLPFSWSVRQLSERLFTDLHIEPESRYDIEAVLEKMSYRDSPYPASPDHILEQLPYEKDPILLASIVLQDHPILEHWDDRDMRIALATGAQMELTNGYIMLLRDRLGKDPLSPEQRDGLISRLAVYERLQIDLVQKATPAAVERR